MTTYNTTAVSSRKPIPGVGTGGGQRKTQIATYTIPAAAATTDVFNYFDLPPHARVVGGWLKTADLDTTTNVTLNVGDTGGYDTAGNAIAADPDRYFSAYSGQAASVTTTMAATGYNFQTGAKKVRVQLVLAAGPSTTAGDVTVALDYVVEEPQG